MSTQQPKRCAERWGRMWVEHYWQVASEKNRKTVEQMVCGYLKDRNLERAKAGFAGVGGTKKLTSFRLQDINFDVSVISAREVTRVCLHNEHNVKLLEAVQTQRVPFSLKTHCQGEQDITATNKETK